MKISVSNSLLETNNLSKEEFLMLILLAQDEKIVSKTIGSLKKKGLITLNRNSEMPQIDSLLLYKTKKLIQELLENIEETENPEKELEVLCKELKALFPKGKKPGTNIYWSEGVQLIKRRLKIFYKKYGHFSDNQVIDAAKLYVSSFRGDHRFMKTLKYFIFKEDVGEGGQVEPSSSLLDYIENYDEQTEIDNSSDWTSTLT